MHRFRPRWLRLLAYFKTLQIGSQSIGHFLTTRLDSEIFLRCGNLRFAWITVLGNKIAGEAGQMVIVYHLMLKFAKQLSTFHAITTSRI